MKVKVISTKGKATANEVSLSKNIFSVEPNDHAIYLDVKQHLANRRQGTHKTKERAEINGSTKKIRKQKGTGSARVGSIKSGTRVGGGRIFGPRPRNYQFKLNLKLKRLARKSAFSYKASSKDIMVVKDFNFDKIKTKDFETLLSDLGIQNEKVLLILGDKSENIYLSSRNLKRVKVVTADTVNTFDLLNATKVVMLESSVKIIENILN